MANLNPKITFKVNLTPDLIGLVHPDRYQTDQDVAISQMNTRTASIDSFFPGLLRDEYVEQKSATTFVAYGEKAHYLVKTYVLSRPSQGPTLKIIGWEYSDGTSLPAGTVQTIYNGNVILGTVIIENA